MLLSGVRRGERPCYADGRSWRVPRVAGKVGQSVDDIMLTAVDNAAGDVLVCMGAGPWRRAGKIIDCYKTELAVQEGRGL